MRRLDDIGKEEIRDLLGKGWLTHDGAWFFNTANQFGIDAANRLNKAAIQTIAPLEMQRTRKLLGLSEEGIESFHEIKEFALESFELILPGSVVSRFHIEAPSANVIHWEWEAGECFAYKGMQRLGLLDGYECGVIYRLECWFEALGLPFEVEPKITSCIMHTQGACSGDFRFSLPL